jgi:hypothetical protein
MKRLFCAVTVLMFLSLSTLAIAGEMVCYPSGNKTADALIYTRAGTLCSLSITTDGTNQCSVLFYDAITATGTEVTTDLTCPGPSSSTGPNTCIFGDINLGFDDGLYADMTKAGGTCTYNVGRRTGH